MIIHEITEECFKKYGKVIDSIDLTELEIGRAHV